MKINKPLRYFLIVFLTLDILYSFQQHAQVALDGDMSAVILPAPWFREVYDDPFGFRNVTEGAVYSGAGRGMAHHAMSHYFKSVPLLLQVFVSPIESIYLACALAKIILQLLIIGLLAAYSTGTGRVFSDRFLIAAALLLPLCQTAGFYEYIGFIDRSITYTFFYALPIAVLLLYFLPFYRYLVFRKPLRLNMVQHILLFSFSLILPLQGQLIPVIVLLSFPLILLVQWWNRFRQSAASGFLQKATDALWQLPKPLLVYFSLIILASLYAFFLSTFNAENEASIIGLPERYKLLFQGLYLLIFKKLAYPLLILMIGINAYILAKKGAEEERRVLQIISWLLLLAVLYTLLLPLGGYRSYRPLVVRRDTFLPVIMVLFYLYGFTTLYVLQHIRLSRLVQCLYLTAVAGVVFAYANADLRGFYENSCEKEALAAYARAAEDPVKLTSNCNVMSWGRIREPQHSAVNAAMFHYWNVTDRVKLYYQEEK